jgi:hypothetical protein
LINNYATYDVDVDIIVDCNQNVSLDAKVYVHNLEDPYYLTWMHRKHFVDNIDDYDYFMYVEDDMMVPYEAFNEYTSNFDTLWELGCVPSFIRIEQYDKKEFVTDITHLQSVDLVTINGKHYSTLLQPYHAFWIMPKKQLKESLTSDFIRVSMCREDAASYPVRDLQKKPMVRIEDNQVSRLCFSYHLANNYASNPNTDFGKIEVKDMLKFKNKELLND